MHLDPDQSGSISPDRAQRDHGEHPAPKLKMARLLVEVAGTREPLVERRTARRADLEYAMPKTLYSTTPPT